MTKQMRDVRQTNLSLSQNLLLSD